MRDSAGRGTLTYLGPKMPVMLLLLVIHHGVRRTPESIRPRAWEIGREELSPSSRSLLSPRSCFGCEKSGSGRYSPHTFRKCVGTCA